MLPSSFNYVLPAMGQEPRADGKLLQVESGYINFTFRHRKTENTLSQLSSLKLSIL